MAFVVRAQQQIGSWGSASTDTITCLFSFAILGSANKSFNALLVACFPRMFLESLEEPFLSRPSIVSACDRRGCAFLFLVDQARSDIDLSCLQYSKVQSAEVSSPSDQRLYSRISPARGLQLMYLFVVRYHVLSKSFV